MKRTYTKLTIALLVCFFVFPSLHLDAKHKKKRTPSSFEQGSATLVSRPPHSGYIPSDIKFDHVISENESYVNMILDRIKRFDFSNYEIHHVNNLGLFLLDAKSDWIKDTLRGNHEWEGYIAPFIKEYVKPNTLVLDIGSHIGTHTLNMSRAVGPNGKVIAFEPQPKTFCELFMNTEINNASNIWCF